jgi:outer membrane protein assembly factor BamE (lipoprotein component of BamABCDE complex)
MVSKRLIVAAAAAFSLYACQAQESYTNAKSCIEVETGMSQEQVRRLMGEPTGEDVAADGGRTWSYFFGSYTDTQPIKIMFGADGRVASKQCAPQAQGDKRPDSGDFGEKGQ